ncbi:fluoride efflux transporter CrcB [soil metagenome]
MLKILLIGSGGFIGAVSRFLFTKYAGGFADTFPLGTLGVNIIGSFLLGFVGFSLFLPQYISDDVRDMITVGFIGGFTTMSSFAFETVKLNDLGHFSLAVMNLVLNITLCIAAVFAGKALALSIK